MAQALRLSLNRLHQGEGYHLQMFLADGNVEQPSPTSIQTMILHGQVLGTVDQDRCRLIHCGDTLAALIEWCLSAVQMGFGYW